MDKKILVGITSGMVEKVMAQTGLDEGEARSLVGIAIRRNADAIVAAIVAQTGALLVVGGPTA